MLRILRKNKAIKRKVTMGRVGTNDVGNSDNKQDGGRVRGNRTKEEVFWAQKGLGRLISSLMLLGEVVLRDADYLEALKFYSETTPANHVPF